MNAVRYIAGPAETRTANAAPPSAGLNIVDIAAGLLSGIVDRFGPGPVPGVGRPWIEDDMKPALRSWWNDGMGGAWLSQWVTVKDPTLFTYTKAQFLPAYYVALFETGKSPGWWTRDGNLRDPRGYIPNVTETAYDAMGMDFDATVTAYERALVSGGDTRRAWTPKAPGSVEQAAANAYQAAANGIRSGGPVTPAAAVLIANEDAAGDGFATPEKDNTLLIVGGFALAALLLLRK